VSTNVYGVTEIVGTSPNGVEDAIESGISRASTTLRGLNWFEVTEIRGHIDEGRVAHYQVGMKVGFRMDA
jgi:flavin-binding protein dodecin